MDENLLLKTVFERTIDQLILHEMVQEGCSSEFSKWRCVIERTLKAVMNETSREKKLILLSRHIEETETQRTVEITEKQNQESLRSQLEFHEKCFEHQKAKLFKTSQTLNTKIMQLKDELDTKIELASQKFVHCEQHEEVLVREFHEKLRQDREEWGKKIAKLESEIELENHRNNEERTKLCSDIERLSETVTKLRANWDELSTKLKKARDELVKKRESIRPRMEVLSIELNKRKTVVDADQQAKDLAEQEHLALLKFTMAVIRIQSWWRGALARKDYVRFKLASVKRKPRTKNINNITPTKSR